MFITCAHLPAVSATISLKVKSKSLKTILKLIPHKITTDNPFSINKQITIGTEASAIKGKIKKNSYLIFKQSFLHATKTTDGYVASPSFFPVRTISHCTGSTLKPYLIKFSNNSLKPPIVSRRKPQLTRPEKSLKFELHEKRESRGL